MRSGSRAKPSGRYLDCHIALQFGVPSAIHLAHAALAYQSEDLVVAEFVAGR